MNTPKSLSTELFWLLLFHVVCAILVLSYVLLASELNYTDWVFASVICAFLAMSFRHIYVHYEKPIESVLNHARHIQEGEYLDDEILEGQGRLTELSTLMRSFGADFAQVKYSYKTQVTDLHYRVERSEAFYEAVLQSVEDAVVVFDESGKIVAANESAGELFLFDESLIDKDIDTLVYEEDSNVQISKVARFPESGWLGVRKRLLARKANHATFPAYVTLNRAAVDNESFFTAVISDISERTELQRELTDMGAKLNAAIYSSVIGFGTVDVEGHFTDANQKFLEWVGVHDYQLLNDQSVFAFVSQEHSNELSVAMNALVTGESIREDCEVKLLRSGEPSIWVFMALSLVEDEGGASASIVFQAIDIDREQELIQEIERKNEELQQRNEDLDQFAYVASHDLKSPLNAIVKLISWIREDAEDSFDEGVRSHFELIESRATRMGNLLDSLLLYSRVGRKDYGYEKIEFNSAVSELYELLDGAEDFSLSCDDLELYVPLVPFQIVVRNLLSNAIKHHHTGKGNLVFKAKEEADHYVITAADDGPGIPEELHSKALEVFQTLKPRDEVEGSGVGLPLIQKIVHRYGGTMQLQSDGQSGTTVRLTWPILSHHDTSNLEASA